VAGYRAVLFDLLTALLDSWTLWNRVARSEALGLAWRREYLRRTYEAGAYRPYEDIVREAAATVAVPHARAAALIDRWHELAPWPEAPAVVRALREHGITVGVVTNCSIALAGTAVAAVGVAVDVVVTAEDAGYYKPDPRPYRLALERLGRDARDVLFVAGSASDVPGAMDVGMSVFWHNRRGLPASDVRAAPLGVAASLAPVLELAGAA
jgi:2-haloacid dehalogenase